MVALCCWIANPFAPIHDTQCTHCGRLKDLTGTTAFISCGCGAMYCGEACQTADPHLLCLEPHTEEHAIFRLKVMALEAGPTHYGTIMISSILLVYDRLAEHMTASADVEDHFPSDESSLASLVIPTHELITQVLGQKSTSISVENWTNLLHYVSSNFLTGFTRSQYAVECDRITAAETWTTDKQKRDDLLLISEATTYMELMDEPDQFFPPVQWFALMEQNDYQHSCIPCTEIISEQNLLELKYQKIVSEESSASCIEPTISVIDNNCSLEERKELLTDRRIVCKCLRCRFELDPMSSSSTISQEDLNRLLEQCKAQERYDDAGLVTDAMVRINPRDGKALFTQARIAGWQGDFQRREVLLRAANDEGVDYLPLETALMEANSYYRRDGDVILNPGDPWVPAKDLAHDVFVGEFVLDRVECMEMVEAAEAFQKDHGEWTTARHYAVPTTDVPVYKIPELLSWLNVQLEQIIFPAMEQHFEIDGRLRIFDAFLVKYDADMGQKRLPIHRDQSEYSLTIAMNPLNEYEGGGTYFSDSNETIRPEVGGVISFRGDVLHAGKMITQGKRYIIVCFIYEQDHSAKLDDYEQESLASKNY